MRHFPLRIVRGLVAAVALSLVAAACGDDAGDTETGATTTPPESTSTAPTSTVTTTTAAPPTPASTPGPVPVPDAALPGEAFIAAPAEGRPVAVAGVRHDDVLNVRAIPGTDGEILAELAPTSNDSVATGRARLLPSSIWWEITTADGTLGWISSRFTAQIGPTTDITAAVIADLGTTPEAETIAELGRLVAEAVDSDPDIPTDIVMSVDADETGDLAEVTYDVIGLGDDAVRGIRVHVFGTPSDSGAGFSLKTIEATDLCDPVRGPTEPGGICA